MPSHLVRSYAGGTPTLVCGRNCLASGLLARRRQKLEETDTDAIIRDLRLRQVYLSYIEHGVGGTGLQVLNIDGGQPIFSGIRGRQ